MPSGIRRTAYVPSSMLYAIRWQELELKETNYSLNFFAPAIWTKTVRGKTTVTTGLIGGSFSRSRFPEGYPTDIVSALEEAYDNRYGGSPEASWDGEVLWMSGKIPLAKLNERAAFLEPILKAIPEVPAGYTGWYQL